MPTLLAASGVQTNHPPAQIPANPHQRILVVDDDELVLQISAWTLLSSGYEVDTAEDGAAAWEALQARSHDLLLTDHNMPKVTGVELLQKLRSARMTLPVILVSGGLPTEEWEQHPWQQFTAILSKPFSPEELLTTVKSVLSAPGDAHDPLSLSFPFSGADGHQLMRPPAGASINERDDPG